MERYFSYKHCLKVVSFIMLTGYVICLQGQSGMAIWETLGRVTFVKAFDPNLLIESSKATLSATVEKINNTPIEIEGYMIPLTGQTRQSHFMLSKFPQSTCFFCGKAGPETAMQVFMKDNQKVTISERKIKVKGTLLINPGDASSLLYSLENATILD